MRASAALAQRIDLGSERRMAEFQKQIAKDAEDFRREQDLLQALDLLAEQCIAEMADKDNE
jgi:hypothetical protein